MYCNGQTLVHKETKVLARMVPEPGEAWAWTIGKDTVFVSKEGTEFVDDVNNYTHVKDELDRPYARQPKEGQFIDESAEKYLVDEETMAQMKEVKLEEWEANILKRMEDEHYIRSAFADGSHSTVMREFFMGRRDAKPLYREYDDFKKKYLDGPLCFTYNEDVWLLERGALVKIKLF